MQNIISQKLDALVALKDKLEQLEDEKKATLAKKQGDKETALCDALGERTYKKVLKIEHEHLSDTEAISSLYQDTQRVLGEAITVLEDEIKQLTLEHGETVKGETLKAVLVSGRVTWDTKALEGIRAMVPQINEFRKEGDPYVVIRK
jgi:hypothetical protein